MKFDCLKQIVWVCEFMLMLGFRFRFFRDYFLEGTLVTMLTVVLIFTPLSGIIC